MSFLLNHRTAITIENKQITLYAYITGLRRQKNHKKSGDKIKCILNIDKLEKKTDINGILF